MSDFTSIFECGKKLNCFTFINMPMKKYTSFKTGGDAALFLQPQDIDSLQEIVKACYDNGIKPFILGNGSNLLVSDCGIDNVVINIGKGLDDIELIDEDIISCQSGCSVMKLSRFALENSLTGLEFAFGIPGSVGGGVYMNAGAYCGEIKDVLFKCEHLNADGSFGSFENDDLQLSYRHSVYCDSDKIITKAYFKLEKGIYDDIQNKMEDFLSRRKDKQPLEFPSAGSTFKRPEGCFASKLIDDCGLKGKSVGGAMVSKKHSGFIINYDNASTSDILKLIEEVQNCVLEKYGVQLEPEVKII